MLTLTLAVLAIGASYDLEEAVATSLSLTSTPDNRFRYDRLTFTDGRSCMVPRLDKYIFNTAAEANASLTFPYPYQTKRGYQKLKITTDDCVTMVDESSNTASILFLVFCCTLGPCCDIFLYHFLKHVVKKYCQRQADAVPLIAVAPAPAPARAPAHPAPSIYAATLMLEAAIQRGDTCPVMLTPLKTATLIVPGCGHILSDLARPQNDICPVCREHVAYTSIPCRIIVEPADQ